MANDAASAPNRAYAFATALIDELARAGVRHACVSPGSRSAPLALAAASHPELRCWSHVDERCAGFFGLGLARACGAPVALICTSGTAAANLHAPVVEAFYGRAPLLVLTADRPPELRGWDPGQTIDQQRLYGSHVRWFAEAPLPEASGEALRFARALAARAAAESVGPPAGPVHLNLPFREPLDPMPVAGDVPPDLADRDPVASRGRPGRAYTRVAPRRPTPAPDQLDRLAELVGAGRSGVIACGPSGPDPRTAAAVARLASASGWPVLADPTSQLRRGPHVKGAPIVAHSDLLLRSEALAARLVPEVVLRVGGTPTSKPLRLWLERHRPDPLILLDAEERWSDPSHLAAEVVRADPAEVCEALAERAAGAPPAWTEAWLEADRRAAAALERELADEEALLEPRAVRELAAALPEASWLLVSNSLPVRELDAFLPVSTRPLSVLHHRGASGIDGLVSSALGTAAARAEPVVLLTGDLALLHDLGGLLAARRHALRLVVVVLNNDGGGIFSLLPIARSADASAFEELFLTPHGLELAPLTRALGADFARATSWEHFRAALKNALASEKTSVVEVPVDRERSLRHHQELERAVRDALELPTGAGAAGPDA